MVIIGIIDIIDILFCFAAILVCHLDIKVLEKECQLQP